MRGRYPESRPEDATEVVSAPGNPISLVHFVRPAATMSLANEVHGCGTMEMALGPNSPVVPRCDSGQSLDPESQLAVRNQERTIIGAILTAFRRVSPYRIRSKPDLRSRSGSTVKLAALLGYDFRACSITFSPEINAGRDVRSTFVDLRRRRSNPQTVNLPPNYYSGDNS